MPIGTRTFAVGAVSMLAFSALSQVSAESAVGLKCHGHAATIVTQPGVFEVTGTPGPDVVVRGAGDQDIHSITTFGGDDIVCTFGDDVTTGAGNDAVYGDGNSVSTGSGADKIEGEGLGSVGAGSGADRIIAGGFSLSVHGEEGTDYISSEGSVYGADGGEGNDIVIETNAHVTRGGPGNDLVMGGTASNNGFGPSGELSGGAGNDRVIAGPLGEWTLWDTPGDDNDRYEANGNPHVRVSYLYATSSVHIDLGRGFARGQGDDRLVGIRGAGGGHHDDVIIGDDYANRIFGLIEWFDLGEYAPSAGADTIRTKGGNDFVFAVGTGTQVWGQNGKDTLRSTWANGGYGNDALFGVTEGPSDDTLIGGPGIDSAEDIYTTDHDTCIAETTTGCEVTHR
jgi:hypothetical protein